MMQLGSIYMTRIGDLDNPVMGVVMRRMWWKPWRYSLHPLYYSHRVTNIPMGEVLEARDGEPIRNLTKLEAIGLMKLMGIAHKDFEDFLGETK